MIEHPIYQRGFKANVLSCFLAFQPLVAENFLAFGEEFLIE